MRYLKGKLFRTWEGLELEDLYCRWRYWLLKRQDFPRLTCLIPSNFPKDHLIGYQSSLVDVAGL